MKKLISLLSFTLACGATAEEFVDVEDIGTLEQPIYMPNSYGHTVTGAGYGQGAACPNTTWPGYGCWVPDNKYMVVQFLASTCDSWWQARFVEAWNYYDATFASWNNEWNLVPPEGGIVKYKMRCTTSGNHRFQQNTSDVDTHDSSRGTLRQYRKGDIYINTNLLQGGSELQRQRSARNSIMHEMGHMFGLGHPETCNYGNSLMCGQNYTSAAHYPSAAELQMIKCYNEDSTTNSDC